MLVVFHTYTVADNVFGGDDNISIDNAAAQVVVLDDRADAVVGDAELNDGSPAHSAAKTGSR